MSSKRQCPQCGMEFEGAFQFCPFDRVPLGRMCATCGKVWDMGFQFCPLDSTPLSSEAGAPPPPAPVERPVPVAVAPPAPPLSATAAPNPAAPAPRPAVPPPRTAIPPDGFTFEQAAKQTWKTMLLRPVTIIFALGTLVVAAAVYFLTEATGGPDLPPPKVTYTLLPNEGKSKGVPVAIKVNQVVVCMVDDPMESGGAARAQQVVGAFEQAIEKAKGSTGVRFAVENVGGRPAVLEVGQNGPDNTTLATVTEGDVALAGETDATRVAARWAERLTDAVKVFVFGEPPTFSVGTEFGDAFATMFKAAVGSRGRLTKKSLERAFQQLTPAQRKALESPPVSTHRS